MITFNDFQLETFDTIDLAQRSLLFKYEDDQGFYKKNEAIIPMDSTSIVSGNATDGTNIITNDNVIINSNGFKPYSSNCHFSKAFGDYFHSNNGWQSAYRYYNGMMATAVTTNYSIDFDFSNYGYKNKIKRLYIFPFEEYPHVGGWFYIQKLLSNGSYETISEKISLSNTPSMKFFTLDLSNFVDLNFKIRLVFEKDTSYTYIGIQKLFFTRELEPNENNYVQRAVTSAEMKTFSDYNHIKTGNVRYNFSNDNKNFFAFKYIPDFLINLNNVTISATNGSQYPDLASVIRNLSYRNSYSTDVYTDRLKLSGFNHYILGSTNRTGGNTKQESQRYHIERNDGSLFNSDWIPTNNSGKNNSNILLFDGLKNLPQISLEINSAANSSVTNRGFELVMLRVYGIPVDSVATFSSASYNNNGIFLPNIEGMLFDYLTNFSYSLYIQFETEGSITKVNKIRTSGIDTVKKYPLGKHKFGMSLKEVELIKNYQVYQHTQDDYAGTDSNNHTSGRQRFAINLKEVQLIPSIESEVKDTANVELKGVEFGIGRDTSSNLQPRLYPKEFNPAVGNFNGGNKHKFKTSSDMTLGSMDLRKK